ncbi:putative nuclear membrane fusion protein Kar5 [Aspergillus vadensis CBS 113365]|uniref:Nuclear membrane fusion protein Kar5 n=1 Tax=Aspergillus vadensis (strain CBS 113365 / IMI 142717 / IBT 24658) TaxID=1448311 RepID=A0A319BRV0_ASPVC|nr:hypothetical protein BO88DRAFT_440472 [Aspergillus vadensis CBS 113365]PYH75244.1 hypothetical protein BO88DRAFT_440472 [Aspergillus vadensis CBS 113365]
MPGSSGIRTLFALLRYLILIVNICNTTIAASSMNVLSAEDRNSNMDVDLASLLTSKNHQREVLFSDALGLVQSMQTLPSCHRMAVSKLVTSCQSIGGRSDKPDPNTFTTLEHIRSIYAVRLAICELNEAGAAVPTSCHPLTMRLPQKKGFFGLSTDYKTHFNAAETVTKGQLESCLRSLESRPQWWTSYSNSRQNAVVICQAARFEIERGEIIELHRSIIEGTIKLDHGLQEALKVAATGLSQYKEFLQSVEDMRSKLVVSMEETELHFKTRFENLILDMGVHVGSILEPVVSTIRNLHSSAASLDKGIANAAESVNDLRHTLKLVEEEGMAWGQQQAVARQQDALAMSDLVSDVQGDIEKLSGTVANFDSALQEQDISKRLSNLETALSGSQIIAEDLRSTQLGQNELQEHLLTNMRISQALIDKTTAAAANLQAIVDDTAKRYEEVPASRRLLGSYPTPVYSLLIGFVGAQSPKAAIVLLVVSICMYPMVYI